MPIFRDNKGQAYAIPSKELEKYKVTDEQAQKLAPQSGRDTDDVELQTGSRPSKGSHPWYAGD